MVLIFIMVFQAQGGWNHGLLSCFWKGLSRPHRWCVLESSFQRYPTEQTGSATVQRHGGIVEHPQKLDPGWASPSECKGRTWKAMEGTDSQSHSLTLWRWLSGYSGRSCGQAPCGRRRQLMIVRCQPAGCWAPAPVPAAPARSAPVAAPGGGGGGLPSRSRNRVAGRGPGNAPALWSSSWWQSSSCRMPAGCSSGLEPGPNKKGNN